MAGCAKDEIVKFEMAYETAVSGVKGLIATELRNHPIFQLKRTADIWCGRLDKSFQLFGVKKIDFFSIDVEGSELGLLEGMDFKNILVNVILIETYHLQPDVKLKVRKILEDANMVLDPWKHRANELWIRKGF